MVGVFRMEKNRISDLNIKTSNAFSTGGGGTNFETRIDAVFLLFLLLGTPVPVLRQPIEKVCFQTKRSGINTDDLLVVGKNNRARLYCQIKHSLTVSENDTTFLRVIKDAWHDYKSERFNHEIDKIALFTGYIAKGSVDALQQLHALAMKSPNAENYLMKLQQSSLISDGTRKKFQTVRSAIQSADSSDTPSDEDLWGFFKVFHLVIFDLDFEASVNKDLLKTIIRCKTNCDKEFIWEKLVDFSQDCNQNPSDITLQNFDQELLELFRKDELRGPTELRRELSVDNFSNKLDDFTAKLALFGSWNDSNREDRKLIEEFFGLRFAEFQKKAQILLADGFPYMSKKDHIWEISDRKTLFKLSEKFYTDDDITKLFSCVRSVVFSHGRKKYADTGKTLIIHSNEQKTLSRTICNGILAGACIVCSDTPKFCTEETFETNKIQLVRTVFDAFGKDRLLCLGDALPYLAEIGGDSYLESLEELLSKDQSALKTEPQSENGYLFRDEICYLLWSIEALVWDPKTFLMAIRCFAELETICHDNDNSSNSPVNSMVSVLLPWYPQTLASVDLQKKAILSLCEEYPEIAQKVIKKLLPREREITAPIYKPRFSQLSIPESISLKDGQFGEMSSFLFEQAMLLSKDDPTSLSELVKYLFPFEMQQAGLLEKLNELGKTWSDEEKFHPWLALTELKYRLIENNCEERDPFFCTVVETIALLEPKDIFFKHQRLFVSFWNEYRIMEDYQRSYKEELAKKQELVQEIHTQYGIRGVMKFGRAVDRAEEICTLFGFGASMDTIRELLLYYKDIKRDRTLAFVALQSFLNQHGYATLLQIGLREELNDDLILDILTNFVYCDTLKSVMEALIPERKYDFWKKVKLPYGYMDGCDIDLKALLGSLVASERYTEIVNLLGNSPKIPSINVDLLYMSLEQAATATDADVLNPHAALKLIGFLQESDAFDLNRLSVIEWYYLPFFRDNSKIRPKALKLRLANSPAFFCQFIQMAFRKHHEVKVEKEEMNEGLSRRLFDLIFKFDVVPGMDENGVFHEDKFLSWTQEAIQWSIENDREDVTKNTIGNGLSYLPLDIEHPLPCSVLKFLNSKENKSVRAGYSMGIYNQRGVHIVDREGKEETILAKKYEDIADAVRAKGYSRFAETLDEIANHYIKEKEWNAKHDLDEE